MKTSSKLLLASAVASLLLPVAGAAELSRLQILFVGEAGSERAGAFKSFLLTHAARVEVASRQGFDPKSADSFDVVLLDWSQGGANRDFPPKKSPLGERVAWNKPAVLLGSAGLHVAITWKGKGGSG